MYLDTNETSNPPSSFVSNTPKIIPVIIMQHPKHHEGSTSRCFPSHYAAAASSASSVYYCRLCVAHLCRPSTFPLLSDATRICIINQRHINLARLPPRNSYFRRNRSPRRSEITTPNAFHSRNRSPKNNGGLVPNTHYPGRRSPNTHRPRDRSPWNSGGITHSRRTFVIVTWVAAPSAQPMSI